MPGARESSLDKWGPLLTKALGRSAPVKLFGGAKNNQDAPRKA